MVRRLVFDDPPAAPATAAAPPAVPVFTKPDKISLDKKGESISLEKTNSDIVVNLNWNQQAGKAGFFGGLKKTDLDLGVLFEMANGEAGVIQALGEDFGDLNDWPYIELDGDDRSGHSAAGETIRINGRYWNEIKRAMVFAYIYDGAANWDATDGVVTVNVSGEPPIEVRMTGGNNRLTMCGIAMLENVGGKIKVSREVEYVKGHEELDDAFAFGLDWTPASK